MRLTLKLLVLLAAAASFSSPVYAQRASTPKQAIVISCSCPDPIGQAYVSAVKSILSKDEHFQQMDLQEGAQKSAIRVHIISMPLQSVDGKPHTALSVVFTHEGALFHQFIETCEHIPISECAMSMVNDLKEMQI